MVIGTTPLEVSQTFSIDRATGRIYERTWVGAIEAIEALARNEEPLAESIKCTRAGGKATLTARYARPINGEEEVPQETQELDVEVIQQSIFHHPNFVGLPEDLIHKVQEVRDNRARPTPAQKKAGILTSYQVAIDAIKKVPLVSANDQAWAIRAFNLLNVGTENYELYSFVLTRTRSMSRRYSKQVQLGTMGRLYSPASLKAITGNPLLFTIPSLTITSAESNKGILAAWRKKLVRVQDIAGGQRQIVEQWQLAKWSTYLYGEVI